LAAPDADARGGEKLKTRPPDATQWTVRTLAKHLRVSRMMVHRVWQRFDVQPHRVEKFKLSNDPQLEEKVGDIAGTRSGAVCRRKKSDSGPGPHRSDPAVAPGTAGTPDQTITNATERPPYLPPSIS